MGSGETRVAWWRQRQVRRHLGGKWNEALILCRQARTDGGVDRRVGGGFMVVAAKGSRVGAGGECRGAGNPLATQLHASSQSRRRCTR